MDLGLRQNDCGQNHCGWLGLDLFQLAVVEGTVKAGGYSWDADERTVVGGPFKDGVKAGRLGWTIRLRVSWDAGGEAG